MSILRSIIFKVSVVFVLILFIGIGLFQAINYYQKRNTETIGDFDPDSKQQKKDVKVEMRILSVDIVTGDMEARLVFKPSDELLDKNRIFLTKDIRVDTDTASTNDDTEYLKGQKMESFDIIITTYGKSSDYPFDTHNASMYLMLTTPTHNTDGTISLTEVPFSLNCISNIHGYDIEISKDMKSSSVGYIDLIFNIKRANSTKTFAIFIIIMMWLLALSTCIVEIYWATTRKIDTTIFAWMGTLLFAMVPLRNAMPEVPPIGVFADYISFFWAEIIVSLSLVSSIITWIFKPPN